MKKIYSLGFVLIVLFAMTMSATALETQKNGNPNPGVLPPDSKPHGSTYGEWSVNWWQWVLSMPQDQNPILDTANCSEGQSGSVWYLGGTFGGEATRECTIPAGKSIFFPIVNVVVTPYPTDTEEMIRAQAKAYIDNTTVLEVSVDGVSLKNLWNYRTDSPAFDLNVVWGEPVTPAISPVVSDGFWLMLAPLNVGNHEISIHGIVDDKVNPSFETKVTYHLVVASKN